MQFSEMQSTESALLQGGTSVVMTAFLYEVIADMLPFLIVAVIVILVDLIFGIRAAQHRKEEVRYSRAFRRTVSKMFEYVCWVTLSSSLAVAFKFPTLEWIILGAVILNEVVSIASNWCEVHGIRIKGLNLPKIIGEKVGVDLSDVKITFDDIEDEQKRDN
jgi:hypothetical protein